MDTQKGDLEAPPAGAEVHPGWRFVKHDFPDDWTLQHASGPVKALAPTRAVHEVANHDVTIVTTSRRNRKGRHPIPLSEKRTVEHVRPRTLLHPFGYRLWGWAPLNISYWVATAFTVGSVAWIVNGTYAMWPSANAKVNLYTIAYTGVLGGFLFEVGSILSFIEMVKRNSRKIDVGHRIEHDPETKTIRVYHSKSDTSYHRLADVKQPLRTDGFDKVNGNGLENGNGIGTTNGADELRRVERRAEREDTRGKWLRAAWQPRSLAYWTVTSQLIGATIFGIPACITGVPHVLWEDYPPGHYVGWDILYWLPQVIGSIFFIINSYLTMVESQHSWWGFKPLDLGWEIGFWNLLGAFGFLFSGLFGFAEYPSEYGQHWGTAFSTWWGSVFFLISSYLLIPEALNK